LFKCLTGGKVPVWVMCGATGQNKQLPLIICVWFVGFRVCK